MDVKKNLRGIGPGGSNVWVGDVGDDTSYWEDLGKIPLQGGPQADGTENLEKEGR